MYVMYTIERIGVKNKEEETCSYYLVPSSEVTAEAVTRLRLIFFSFFFFIGSTVADYRRGIRKFQINLSAFFMKYLSHKYCQNSFLFFLIGIFPGIIFFTNINKLLCLLPKYVEKKETDYSQSKLPPVKIKNCFGINYGRNLHLTGLLNKANKYFLISWQKFVLAVIKACESRYSSTFTIFSI